MNRVMIIPAAGRGSRLGSSIPKILFPVDGRPMIDHLLARYQSAVSRFILVLGPGFADEVMAHCAGSPLRIDYAIQAEPTGMLDAILIPHDVVRQQAPSDVWITWCDQIAVSSASVEALSDSSERDPVAEVILPTLWKKQPYIHFERDEDGIIRRVLHRREGDAMPDLGEGDIGLFRLSLPAYLRLLPEFAREASSATATGERNFLPFIPWLRARGRVVTFPAGSFIESIGVNAPEDLALVEAHFRDAR
jgi:bifunctional UDP-N-acetylglucosamine pyrophosphorylase/glucosamine-1-phosphate N-acetyltransferase